MSTREQIAERIREEYGKHPTLDWPGIAAAKILATTREERQPVDVDKIVEAVNAEPELTDDMPDEMWEACRGNRKTMQEAFRVVVRLTKDGIRARLTKLLTNT